MKTGLTGTSRLATSVGMAMASRWVPATFNPLSRTGRKGQSVGLQIGQVFERKRAEADLQEAMGAAKRA